MNTVVQMNTRSIQRFVNDPNGGVARYLIKKGELVERQAYNNASGPVLGVISNDLRSLLESHLEPARDGLSMQIGTTALHGPDYFGYPRFHDQNGRPWLTGALRTVFP